MFINFLKILLEKKGFNFLIYDEENKEAGRIYKTDNFFYIEYKIDNSLNKYNEKDFAGELSFLFFKNFFIKYTDENNEEILINKRKKDVFSFLEKGTIVFLERKNLKAPFSYKITKEHDLIYITDLTNFNMKEFLVIEIFLKKLDLIFEQFNIYVNIKNFI